MNESKLVQISSDELTQLKAGLSEAQGLLQKYKELSSLSQDPVLEIKTLREQLTQVTSRCADLQEELNLLHMTRRHTAPPVNKKKAKKEELFQALLDARPNMTDQELSLAKVLVSVVEGMWPNDGKKSPTSSSKTQQMMARDGELAKLRKENETYQGKMQVFEMTLDAATTENMQLKEKISDLETQAERLILDLAVKEEETEEYRPVVKQKYTLECEKQDLQLQNEKLSRQCERLKQEMEELTLHSVTEAQDIVAQNENLTAEIGKISGELKRVREEKAGLEACIETQGAALGRYEAMEREFQVEHARIQTLKSSLQSLSQELEDSTTEKAILQKKLINETKDLKSELAKEHCQKEELRTTLDECRKDLKQIQDVRSTHAKVAAASSSERRFVETLSKQVTELEGKNKFLMLVMAQVEEVKVELIKEKQRSSALTQEVATLKTQLLCMSMR